MPGSDTGKELDGDFVAALAPQERYHKNIGQVVSVSTRQLRYVRRKELRMEPYAIEIHDLADCRGLKYKADFAPHRLIFGVLSLAVGLAIIIGLWFYRNDLGSGMVVKIAAVIAPFYVGIRYLTGGRRHVLTFVMKDENLRWRSKPGEFGTWQKAVDRILEFGRQKGWFESAILGG